MKMVSYQQQKSHINHTNRNGHMVGTTNEHRERVSGEQAPEPIEPHVRYVGAVGAWACTTRYMPEQKPVGEKQSAFARSQLINPEKHLRYLPRSSTAAQTYR